MEETKDSTRSVLPHLEFNFGPILLVEDDPSFARILTKRLEMNGFEVMHARDGREGLEMAIEKQPDLIITDWMMPRMDGLSMVKEIRRSPALSGVYVVMVSNKADTDEKVQGFDCGADDYLPKDCDNEELLARIRAGMRIRTLQQALIEQARVDQLTLLYNRGHFFDRLEEELRRMGRYEQELTVAMVDVDDFKDINDTYGHLAGDGAIRYVAKVIRECCRDTDVVARYGGDEFAIMFLSADAEHAESVLMRIGAYLESFPYRFDAESIVIRSSFGIAQADRNSLPAPDDLVALADERLYEMKKERHAARA